MGPLATALETPVTRTPLFPRAAVAALPPLILALALAAACSSGGGSHTSPSPSRSPSPAATTSPTPTSVFAGPAFSRDRALEVTRVLSVEIGPRTAGSDAETRAAQYIRDQLASFGYRAQLQPFTFESFEDLGTSLEVTSPGQTSIDAHALGASPSGAVQAALLYAGRGHLQEIPSGSSGSVLLIERGDIPFSEKVANAEAAGAAGVIVFNNKAGILNGRLSRPSNIPAAGITQADGQSLRALLEEGPVTVHLETRTRQVTATSHNVVATPPDGSCSIVAGGHYDSVPESPGANDNASGTAVVVEMARVRAAAGDLDEVCYVLFGAEEIGLLGSAHYVGSLAPGRLAALEAMLNFDMLAVGDSWPLVGAPEITSIAGSVADSLGIEHTTSSDLPENLGSDHQNFAEAGVPSIIFNCFCDPNYHSSQDTIEFVDPERLQQAGEIGLGIIERLLDT